MSDVTAQSDGNSRLHTVVMATILAIGAFVVGNLVAVGIVSVLESFGLSVIDNPEWTALVSAIALQGIGFGGLALLYLRSVDGADLIDAHVPGVRGLAQIVGGVFALLLALRAITFALSQAGIQTAESQLITSGLENPQLLLLLIPLSLVLVGPAEELLYRGIVQGLFKRAIGPAGAIVATSAVFASIHVFGLVGPLTEQAATIGVIFFLALFLGALYEFTENLIVPSVVHGLFNATQFFLAYLIATGRLPGMV